MHIGDKGLDLIASYEGYRLEAYKNPGESNYTIGYGHCGPDVYEGQKITRIEALSFFRKDLESTEKYVDKYVKSFVPNQNQYDALVSYCYNRGPKGLKQLCDNSKTAEDFSKNLTAYWGTNIYCKKGIMNRRKAEQELFNTPCNKSKYEEPSKDSTFRNGSTGNGVKWIQNQLNKSGKCSITVDGIYGSKTERAVKVYQEYKGLVADGIAGPKTIAKLRNEK